MTENPFEIPQTMRDLAEQNVKQAHIAYEQLADFMTKSMNAWMGAMPQNPTLMGFKMLQDRAMDFATENAESAFSLAGRISSAQTIQEVFELQTQFAQDRMQAFVAHTRELYSLIGQAVQMLQRG